LDGQFVASGNLISGADRTLSNHVAQLGMFVKKEYRRQGIGSQLLMWLIAWASAVSLEKISLQVFSSNGAAIGLYHKCGFVEEGRFVRQIKEGGVYKDLICMAHFL
jgi:RimJ/RimL family protein N-acetyltransferase